MDLAELRRQHDEITALLRAMRAATADNQQKKAIGPLRWQLARLLMTHLAMEDAHFYAAVERHGDPEAILMAKRFKNEMGGMANSFSAYMADWSDSRITSHWTAFCAETNALLAAITTRIEREDNILFPMAEKLFGNHPARA